MKKLRVVVLQVEVEVGIGVSDGKVRRVEEEIGLRVEEEEGAVVDVGKKTVKTMHVASIEDLKKRLILVFKILHILYKRENDESRIKIKIRHEKKDLPFEITSVVVVLPPLLLPLPGVGRWEVD